MGDFFAAVYMVVAAIPKGRVATYGQIAFLAGNPRGARAVGYAMHAAPDGLPCHRVVARTGILAPEYLFAPLSQRRMLEEEGAVFLPDGRLDLEKCLWRPGQDARL